ncbi:sensor histidine kinase [Streptomyces albidoflavus]|uniref:sensor histidine kinase n=1 Tax=Streptomyces albidoflavus TaxID=1886 RepID=UPI0034378001
MQSIASQTIRSSTDRSHFKDSFESRLLALSKTHDLLTRNAWRDADLKAIADQELAPYRRDHDTRVTMRGPPVRLPARVAINFGLVLHELVTNAVKYGALSTVDGRVTLAWTIDSYTPGRPRLIVHWSETGGPAVPPPKHQGFGSRLIQRSVKSELGGQLNVAFLPSGVVYDLFVPLEEARHHRSFR